MRDGLTDNRYIVVPRWEEFQHYKERHPVWIKVYTKLLQDPAYLELSLASRGLLHGIWLAYAQKKEGLSVRDARVLVSASSGLTQQLKALNDAGWIELSASKLLAIEEEVEVEPPKPPIGGLGHDELLRDVAPQLTKKELRRYTGCRWVRGQMGATHKRDPLGIDRPPPSWPYEPPSKAEIVAALTERKRADELADKAERQFQDEVEAVGEEIDW